MTTASKFADKFRDGIGDTRCIGCEEPLEPSRRSLGYCGKRCRRIADTAAKGIELDAVANRTKQRADYEAADAKWAAVAGMKAEVRAGR
jgi:hypothetical protein